MENVSKIWSFISSMESPRFGSSTRGSNNSNLPIWKRGLMAGNTTCDDKIRTYAILPTTTLLETLQTTRCGLSQQEAAHRLEVGSNTLSSRKPPKWWQLLLRVIPSYFNILLVIIAIISILCIPREWKTFGVILCMILASCLLQFWQESQGVKAALKLQASTSTTVRVRRFSGGSTKEVMIEDKDLVPGDILFVDPGTTIPADSILLESVNLSVSQSTLTGENEPVRKIHKNQERPIGTIFDLENFLFMGSSVISGNGIAVVVKTGDDAFIATVMEELDKKRPLNSFQRGIRNVSLMMIGFMAVMVPIVLVISGKVTGNWGEAVPFAISVDVGLVPEMLPAIVNSNLARGAFVLAKKKAIVKRLDSIQNLGAMTVLCSDKTGTLTKDEITLQHYVDTSGIESLSVFELAYINARDQSGKKNAIDSAILNHDPGLGVKPFDSYEKIGEIPFNFESRRSSSITRSISKGTKLICKGAYEELMSLASHVRIGNEVIALDEKIRGDLSKRAADFNCEGYRAILLATRTLYDHEIEGLNSYHGLDSQLIVEGLLTFLDPPKDDAKFSIARLQKLGIDCRVLTGDNLDVAMKVCRSLELVVEIDDEYLQAIKGPDLAKLEGTDEFDRVVKHCKIFAKLTPIQKGQVVTSLQKQKEVVGMLGDGINDCVALRAADVGISVDTAADVAKDCADVILTQKELTIIADSVVIGRITQGNTIKYIKMVISSNFGNVFSVLIASAWLPFNPMTGLQMLVQNVLYDVSQIAIPWDNMDAEDLEAPQRWQIWDLLRFIIILGLTSSTIDLSTFIINWFYYGVQSAEDITSVKVFHTHWFLQSLLTQTIVVHLLRTAKWPVIQSRASKAIYFSTTGIMVIGYLLPYIPPIANLLGFTRPKPSYIGLLGLQVFLYCLEVQVVKLLYIKPFHRWL